MRHLRYFVALAEHGNFRRAADRLAMAQPPLSRQIRALEQELGCRLVLRTPRGVVLTAAGRAFLDQARIALAQAQRAIDCARVAAPENADRLVVGGEVVADMAVIGRTLAALARSHPALRVDLRQEPAREALASLVAGTTELAVVALPAGPLDAGLTVEAIGAVPLCLAVPTGHPFAGPRPVSWRRLADAPFVLFDRDAAPVLFDAIVGTFRSEAVVLHPHHCASGPAAALTLVAAGLGVSVVPSGWHSTRAFGVTCRPLRPPSVTVPLGVAYRRDARSPAVSRFVETARSVLASALAPAPPRVRSGAEGVS